MKNKIRLGVNIDHIATLRNARGGTFPDPIHGALIAGEAGADGITAHLREDRRHIKDEDIYRLKKEVNLPLNMEMAATDEMLNIALDVKPNACCIVPEKRKEITTEGGLNIIQNKDKLEIFIKKLKDANIRVSLFVDADIEQISTSKIIGADIVEIHTGEYCNNPTPSEFKKIVKACDFAEKLSLEPHAGHGLNYSTTKEIAKIKTIKELNIGHFLISDAIHAGLNSSVKKMRKIIDESCN